MRGAHTETASGRHLLVVGLGSIGRRHLRNLRTLGIQEAAGVDEAEEARERARKEEGIKVFPALDVAIQEWAPDGLLICTSAESHAEVALVGARGGAHLFVEKPLAVTLDGFDDLVREVEVRRLITMVGCNMRFHPGPARVKEIVSSGGIGRVLGARIAAGSFMPDWLQGRDYRRSWRARREQGGGALFDYVHELDIACWLLGWPEAVVAMTSGTRVLDIEADESVEVLLRFPSGVVAEVHLDYLQRAPQRRYELFGEEGTVVWDIREGSVDLYTTAHGKWEHWSYEPYDLNTMYVDEIRCWLECLERRMPTPHSLGEGGEVVRLTLAVAQSAAEGRTVAFTPGRGFRE